MPKVNFTEVPDSSGFDIIPAGGYLFQIISVDNSKFDPTTGAEKWKIKMQVIEEGEHKGSLIWDNWNWDLMGKGIKRIKYNLRQIGIDVDGEAEVVPETILGRVLYCAITVEHDSRDPLGKKLQNRIPWDGWKKLDEHPTPDVAKKLAEEAEKNFKLGVKTTTNDKSTSPVNPDEGYEDVPF